jgi:hypothetical protein
MAKSVIITPAQGKLEFTGSNIPVYDFTGSLAGYSGFANTSFVADESASLTLTLEHSGSTTFDIVGSGSTIFGVQGSVGSLFSLTDTMSGSLFSVNTVAGLPVIEVFSDETVVLGPSSAPLIVLPSGNVSGSATSTGSFGSVHTAGNVGIGTNNPAQTLEIHNSNASDYTDFGLRGTGHKYVIGVGNASVSTVNDKWYLYDNDNIAFRMVVDTSGNVGIGNTSPNVRLGQKLDIATSDDYGGMSLSTWSTVTGDGAILDFKKSGNATIGTHGAVADDEQLGYIVFRGSDGVEFLDAAVIKAEVDGAITGGGTDDMPGRLIFATTADDEASTTERLRIDSAGNVGIGGTPVTLLDLHGASGVTQRLTSTNTNITGAENVGKIEAYISDASGNLPGVVGSIAWATNGSIDGGSTKGTNFTLKTYLESSGLVTAMTVLANGNATFAENVAIGGATHQTWHSGVGGMLHLGGSSSIGENTGYLIMSENSYLDASDDYRYITDGKATMYYQGDGTHNFRVSNHTGNATELIHGDDTWLDVLYISNSGNATFAGGITFSQGGSASDNSIYHHTNNWMYVMGGTSGLALKGENSDDATVYLDNSNQRITLYTNNEERLKIDNSMALFSGYVRATTSSSNYIEILGYDSPQAGYVQTSSGCEIRLAPAGSTKMQINPNGNIGAPTGSNIYNASDKRLKRNIVNLSNSLTKINQMQGVSFNWIDGFCDDEKDTTLYGLIAQDLQSVDSNLVAPFGNGSVVVKEEEFESPLRVNEKFVIPMLVEAVKELSAKVEALENA